MAAGLSAAALAVVALHVLRTTTPANIWHRQTVMIGLTLLIISPNYPWYALLLLPFIVLSRHWEYVAVILALDLIYMVPFQRSERERDQSGRPRCRRPGHRHRGCGCGGAQRSPPVPGLPWHTRSNPPQ